MGKGSLEGMRKKKKESHTLGSGTLERMGEKGKHGSQRSQTLPPLDRTRFRFLFSFLRFLYRSVPFPPSSFEDRVPVWGAGRAEEREKREKVCGRKGQDGMGSVDVVDPILRGPEETGHVRKRNVVGV